jgi:hypothetical protein
MIRSIEEKHGQDEVTFMVLFLIEELKNPNSLWKPYLDLLPRQLPGVASRYWTKNKVFEKEVRTMPIIGRLNFLIKERLLIYM